jgi:purine-cytosine permease-like protein
MQDVPRKNHSLERARMRAVLTGLAFFFPGFLFSLPLTCAWAEHHYAGEAQSSLGAIGPSFVIGLLSAAWCTIHLLRKAGRRTRSGV